MSSMAPHTGVLNKWGKKPFFNSVKLKVLGNEASGIGKKHNESMNLRGPLLKDNTLAPTVS